MKHIDINLQFSRLNLAFIQPLIWEYVCLPSDFHLFAEIKKLMQPAINKRGKRECEPGHTNHVVGFSASKIIGRSVKWDRPV